MTSIAPTGQKQSNQVVTETSTDGTQAGSGTEFAKVMRRHLGTGQNAPKEQDLFAALIAQQLESKKGSAALESYTGHFAEFKAMRGEGERASLFAANRALKKARVEGLLSREEAHEIRSRAFGAAQLDDDPYRLSAEPAVTISDVDTTLGTIETKLAAYDTGADVALRRPERRELLRAYLEQNGEVPVEGTGIGKIKTKAQDASDGFGGFLWKPISDVGHKLVVLLPTEFNHNVKSVSVKTDQGKVLETGQPGGIANGDREHFRFSKPGDDYPANVYLSVTTNDGKEILYRIPDPSQRYD